MRVADRVPLRARGLPPTVFAVVLVEYEQGEPDQFGLLLSVVPEGRRARTWRRRPGGRWRRKCATLPGSGGCWWTGWR
ncbi:hypothetical protein O0235_10680 [Tepidiforma flava]|uniref:Uncharacterized protein n=1 Tax=Tepidiforma flava TaxID=3004094 RepID=A0ABY7M3Y9_9CHLR|nr:hypothetical protein [Tepidiforma flava]WBL35251.1 hypothetical protein O0235_10680 [Tepidiforma flava]